MHRRDDIDDEEPRASKLRPPTSKPKAHRAKKMPNQTTMENGPFSAQNFRRMVDADPSNRSSSGSAVSYSESCAPYYAADASEMTGSGSVLLRNPYSKSLEEESEASSIPAENKSYITSESYSGSASFVVHSGSREASNLNAAIERPKRSRLQIEDSVRRDTLRYENLHILESVDSPLVSVDLEDVINYTNFVRFLSKEDQQQLLKLLPPIDSSTPPKSYQRLLGEGILDPSFSIDEEGNAVKMLALTDLTKCNWLECYAQQKGKVIKETGEEENNSGSKSIAKPTIKPLKRPRDTHFQSCAELNVTMRSPKRVLKLGALASQHRSSSLPESGYATKDLSCTGGALNLFMLPPEKLSSLIPPQYTENYSDQDLLLDIPVNARHPEAELLCQPSQLSSITRSSTSMGRVVEGEGRLKQS
ncbi:hypothetical protein PR202_ga19501 [Eleusine coracana subsp. coracana]|uniref:ASX DEUBAD domain-containing protein n=1 Tax=Eleusine coracana subsp. coracana TaxID=191504 RepID=A0AAV5CUR2_ELECO|nr:hypothetical protein PR202_ga19501 [Eleusine coracana subsp. coracana]